MQEEIEQKSFNIMISTTKLSARTVLRAVKAAFRLYQSKASQGKQSVRTLLRQNRGVSSVEISKTGIRGLERYAKKYGIDYAIRKDSSEVPPRYLVFFKAPDAEAFNSAFKEYSAYADFTERLKHYDMSQAEFIRQAITRATIRPIVTVSPANDELLSAVGRLTAEYGKIGGNLNQIARALNEYGTPYNALSVEVRAAISDLAALKFEVLRKVGDAVGNIQTYQL